MITLAGTPAGSTPISGTLIIVGLVVACVGLFFALTHSLRTARRNLGPPRRFAAPGPESDRAPGGPPDPAAVERTPPGPGALPPA